MIWRFVPLAALLVGCAAGHMRPGVPASTVSSEQNDSIVVWRADGRVAVQRGDEGWSATLRWHQRPAGFQLRLIAPLGRGTYQLAGDDAEVELLAPDGRRFYASDPESLMAEHLGWSIPVSGAQYWLRGLVAPGPPPSSIRRDEAGRLQDVQQAGWRISVLRHMRVGDFELPAKLYLQYQNLKVRIVVSSWKLGP